MKKKLFTALLMLFMLFSLVGCGAEKEDDDDEKSNKREDKVEEVLNQNTKISVGEVVTMENGEFSIEKTNITNKVTPPKASGYYSYYEADSGKVYVDVIITYKNLATSDVDADEIVKGTLKFKGSYEYTGFVTIEEDNRSDFTYANITSISPLSTEYLHYLFEVPENVSTEDGNIVVTLTFEEKSYDLEVRSGTTSSNESSSNNKKPQVVTDKLVGKNEKQTIDGVAEFYIEKSNITNKVTPPKASGYYSYYEADNGKIYVDVVFAYKNLESSNADADEVVSASLKYAGKYDYTGFATIEEDNRSDFTYANITSISPLATEYIHYLFEVPESIRDDSESIEIYFNIGGSSYIYKVR